MKPGRYTTSQTLIISQENKEVGFLQISNLPISKLPKVLLEYHKDKKADATAKYKMLFKVVHPNISRIVACDCRSADSVIAYERTDFTLENIILKKELFWKFDQGKLICMTEEYQKFIIGIWKGLLYLNKEKISFKFGGDFKKIFLIDGKLSQPKFFIMNKVEVTTGSDNDLKLLAGNLKLIILGIHKQQGLLQTSHRGWKNLMKMLDDIHYCQNPLQAVKEHPEISGTRGKILIVKAVYDRLLSGRLADIEKWFTKTRSVKLSYHPWSICLQNSPVESVYLGKSWRYKTPGLSDEVEEICGLVKLMRDSMHHVNDDVNEEAKFMKDEDIVGFFDWKFSDFFVELHYYIHKLNPARHLMIVGSIGWCCTV